MQAVSLIALLWFVVTTRFQGVLAPPLVEDGFFGQISQSFYDAFSDPRPLEQLAVGRDYTETLPHWERITRLPSSYWVLLEGNTQFLGSSNGPSTTIVKSVVAFDRVVAAEYNRVRQPSSMDPGPHVYRIWMITRIGPSVQHELIALTRIPTNSGQFRLNHLRIERHGTKWDKLQRPGLLHSFFGIDNPRKVDVGYGFYTAASRTGTTPSTSS
ncbi:hypothetical protein BCV70DRAFT_42282 [Testicularia cyperi]|uniref:Uncharacterized protein n=1 Tax=Testicularia cyperi TaxID=1882483 RepID=A0A317XHW6_9BASI|nr:hypothetical protein BCV70DRAFT_42282 [Testicularia cyperi]